MDARLLSRYLVGRGLLHHSIDFHGAFGWYRYGFLATKRFEATPVVSLKMIEKEKGVGRREVGNSPGETMYDTMQ